MVKIMLNDNPETLDTDRISVTELLKRKNYSFKMLIVKINGKLVKKDEYETSYVNDGDDVMVLHLISGG